MTRRYEIAIAGLLHDIGKLGQRAFPSRQGLSSQSLRMEDQLCPLGGDPSNSHQRYHTHIHVLYTNEFFNSIESYFPSSLDIPSLINISVKHHLPTSDEERLIAEADRLASKIERVDIGTADNANTWRTFRRKRLYPLANEVGIDESSDFSPKDIGHKVNAWDEHAGVLFPVNGSEGELEKDYNRLWLNLIEKFSQNHFEDPFDFIAQALSDLESFTWCVPSATNAFPDISLFDHSRAVAALAVCLADCDDVHTPFLLISGDFSGIQRYIFNLQYGDKTQAKGFTRQLRARSFNVRLFTEQLVIHILKKTGFPLTQKIISAGGKFFMVLPNNEPIQKAIIDIATELDQWSLDETDGRLRFNLASVALSKNDVRDFSGSLRKVNDALAEQSSRPLSYGLFSGRWEEKQFLRPQERIGQTRDADYEREGAIIPKSDCVSFVYTGRQNDGFFPFGRFHFIKTDDTPQPDSIVYHWKNREAVKQLPFIRSRFALHVPTNSDGDILTFEEIAGKSLGRKALGFIKADVDNLGFIFTNGLKEVIKGERDIISISRIATLSRMVEGFFGNYVDNLIQERYPHIYLVFSGGDDLVAVGPWNEAVDFIIALRKELDRYVDHCGAWGMSASVLVSNPRTPLLQAVEQAENGLERAKSVKGKDCITFLDLTLHWTDMMRATERGKQLYYWLKGGVLRTSQIRRLMTYARMHNDFRKTGDAGYLKYVYLLIYDLKRNWRNSSDDERAALAWAQQLADPSFDDLRALNIACQYALYANRSSSEG